MRRIKPGALIDNDNENLLNKRIFCKRFQLLIMVIINNKADLGVGNAS